MDKIRWCRTFVLLAKYYLGDPVMAVEIGITSSTRREMRNRTKF